MFLLEPESGVVRQQGMLKGAAQAGRKIVECCRTAQQVVVISSAGKRPVLILQLLLATGTLHGSSMIQHNACGQTCKAQASNVGLRGNVLPSPVSEGTGVLAANLRHLELQECVVKLQVPAQMLLALKDNAGSQATFRRECAFSQPPPINLKSLCK